MRKIVFLLEEPSMKEFLDSFLPRLIPGLDFLCLRHEGKQDLRRSIPRKLKAWENAIFVVLHDNDSADCITVKNRLQQLCRQGGRSDTLIRIVCQELESWYLGVPATLASVYSRPRLAELSRKSKYRNPDMLPKPSAEVQKLVPEFRKTEGARRMGAVMPLDESESTSRSFQVFVNGIRRVIYDRGSRST